MPILVKTSAPRTASALPAGSSSGRSGATGRSRKERAVETLEESGSGDADRLVQDELHRSQLNYHSPIELQPELQKCHLCAFE
ncbi:hypothetical protein E2320_019346 [Naja naja]|nr:hypothetical protein E2320_019346 [Naja naja]